MFTLKANNTASTMTLPNIITLSRIALLPFIVIFYCLPMSWGGLVASCLYVFASITDWADGYLARRLNQTSEFGAFLDPVSDKLFVSVMLVTLTFSHSSVYMLIPALIIIAREIAVGSLREWMAIKGRRDVVKVTFSGKLKTATQMVAIFILLSSTKDSAFYYLGLTVLSIAAILSLYSMSTYFKSAFKALKISAT